MVKPLVVSSVDDGADDLFDAAREEANDSQEQMAERRKLIEKRKEDNEMRIQFLREEVRALHTPSLLCVVRPICCTPPACCGFVGMMPGVRVLHVVCTTPLRSRIPFVCMMLPRNCAPRPCFSLCGTLLRWLPAPPPASCVFMYILCV